MDLEGLTYVRDPSAADGADPADVPQGGKHQKHGSNMGSAKRPSLSKVETKR